MKGWFTINSEIKMNYTSEMEKAMQTSHRIGYADYCRNLDKRMKVERKRTENYKKSKQIVSEIDNNIFK